MWSRNRSPDTINIGQIKPEAIKDSLNVTKALIPSPMTISLATWLPYPPLTACTRTVGCTRGVVVWYSTGMQYGYTTTLNLYV